MRLGFIGTGVITEAIVTGLLRAEAEFGEICLSARNREVSTRLAQASDRVRVCEDNQQIVDESDLLFLAIRPQDAEAVLSSLRFRPQQHVCSLIATIPAEMLESWAGTDLRIFRAIPLPSVAALGGVTALFPSDPLGASLFGQLGTAVDARTIAEFDAFAISSALMGTYFGILESAAGWMSRCGIENEDAKSYLDAVFLGLARTSSDLGASSYAELRQEHSTPGGLNEQMFDVFASSGGTEALSKALDTVARRVHTARTQEG
ncbi:pyrroline-5-carboxylate reductase [Tropicimonas sp. TH_r6]|uniref:pyrroline-5-carboxylate reductase n=1 Tax=Tropicimonas sp. TH_r6 TaxID=3082085 RepID=UPI00295553DE|nr:pyrroline-5-carboxylate reductase [Tropicimonas sp. TH_r6]MDV7145455.1 pyrroline-5-carboxylate reductase [Tropicimonas sp. TH_r6]